MVIAWVMAASVGTLFPVYMKKTWVGKQIMGKDRWFVVSSTRSFFSTFDNTIYFIPFTTSSIIKH